MPDYAPIVSIDPDLAAKLRELAAQNSHSYPDPTAGPSPSAQDTATKQLPLPMPTSSGSDTRGEQPDDMEGLSTPQNATTHAPPEPAHPHEADQDEPESKTKAESDGDETPTKISESPTMPQSGTASAPSESAD